MVITTNNETGNRRRHPLPIACTVAAAVLILSPRSEAAEWKFAPTLDVKESYTDNVRLTGKGTEKSDFVTQVSPGISVAGTGPGLKLNLRYVMQNLAYASEKDKNRTAHQLTANTNAELLKNLFFLDGTASINQQNISALGPQAVDNISITDNRTDVKSYSISPYLRHRFGSTASSELRYTRESVNTSKGGLLDSETDRILFSVDSGAAFRTLGWGLQYSDQKIDHSDANSIDLMTASGNLRYMVSEKFTLNTRMGYEKNNYISIGDKPQGTFWAVGFSWKPSNRTSLTSSAGHRFYGKTFSLLANHRARHSMWSVGYNEDITTTQSQFLVPATIDTADYLNQLYKTSIPDPIIRQQVVDAVMHATGIATALSQNSNTITNRVFLQKSLQASVALTGAKNTLLLSIFNTSREAQTAQSEDNALFGTGNLSLDDRTRQLGVNALWNWRMSPRTSVNASAGYSRINASPTGRKSKNKTVGLALTRQFQPKLKGTIELRRQQQSTTESTVNFRENAISASLSMGF